MGTCCGAHLQTKIRDYAKNAQNGAVTITIIENPRVWTETVSLAAIDITITQPTEKTTIIKKGKCDYCDAPAEFAVSYYPK